MSGHHTLQAINTYCSQALASLNQRDPFEVILILLMISALVMLALLMFGMIFVWPIQGYFARKRINKRYNDSVAEIHRRSISACLAKQDERRHQEIVKELNKTLELIDKLERRDYNA